ncbi:MAG: cryptochrome/photolyase family protein [Desulfobacteraceae bacterium]
MKQAAIIFPHQLFEVHPAITRQSIIYLVEDQLFFRDFHYPARFHQQKLVLHRASLWAYRDRLESQGLTVRYLEYRPDPGRGYLFEALRQDEIDTAYLAAPVDYILEKRLRREAGAANLKLHFLTSPGFLCSEEEIREYFQGAKRYFQTKFYQDQRRRRNILMAAGQPQGGRWTYDTLNRRRLPRDTQVPPLPDLGENPYVTEAKGYVQEKFADHPGSLTDFNYPVTHAAAAQWLEDFLQQRLEWFGDFEDAISAREPYLFHSVISPLINIGLLTPAQVLEKTLAYAQDHPVPLNSLEGFVRQILGWREYVRAMYLLIGVRQRTANFWNHQRKLPPAFYAGTTGIDPVDTVIQRLQARAYAHHIERLMVLGNFMLLCEIDPNEVYRWFMEMFIDAYDWVMVPNVYSMSQFADGGLMMTKPYLSSSRYLLKMSDYPQGPWCEVWDGLYWRFINQHREYFAKNPRLRPMLGHLSRMAASKREKLFEVAEHYLAQW